MLGKQCTYCVLNVNKHIKHVYIIPYLTTLMDGTWDFDVNAILQKKGNMSNQSFFFKLPICDIDNMN